MYTDVMLDLETMSNENNAAIVSIGAFSFNRDEIQDPETIQSSQMFYMKGFLNSAMELGAHVSGSTIRWWMQQEQSARKEIIDDIYLPDALYLFNDFVPENALVWGFGSTFDNVVLRSAYASANAKPSWKYRQDVCYRTLKNLFPDVPEVKYGVKHNALHDAIAQGLHLQQIFKVMKGLNNAK